MSTLIPVNDFLASKYGNDESFKELVTSSSFLPRFQLFGANSDAVKRSQIPMAHYGLVLDTDLYEDLGEQVDVLVICWRPKALRITEATPISFFDPSDEEFIKIQKESEQPDSKCMFGPEFLLYLPRVKKFCTFFMASKTQRRQAPHMRALVGKGATLKVQLIETAKYSWHGPIVTACLSQFDIPPLDEIRKVAEPFRNPDKSSVEFDPEKIEAENPDKRVR